MKPIQQSEFWWTLEHCIATSAGTCDLIEFCNIWHFQAAILMFLWHWNVRIQWNSSHIEFLSIFQKFLFTQNIHNSGA